MHVTNFSELEAEFLERVNRHVWCSAATVDTHGRPRSRILHPIWQGATGWILTGRQSPKASHLAQNAHISLAYIAEVFKPVYVETSAVWVDELAEKQRMWEFFKQTPPPLGYDPAIVWPGYDHESFGVLKLTPWRIEVADFPQGTRVWRAP